MQLSFAYIKKTSLFALFFTTNCTQYEWKKECPKSTFLWKNVSTPKFLCKKDPKLLTIFVCYIAMETRKEILCGGIKLYPSTKAHI